MRRIFNADSLNQIVKHPEVRPWLGIADPKEELDFSTIAQNPDNFLFMTECERGGYLLAKVQPGLYAAHTFALPEVRGRPMHRLMIQGFDFMFTATDCLEVASVVADGNSHAMTWANVAGFRETFRRESFIPLMGEMVGGQFFSLVFQDWVQRSSACAKAGGAFHALLHDKLGHENHPEDGLHNRWVGAVVECARAGNLAKGVMFYNRWAPIAGYGQARIVSVNPPLIDMGTGLVSMDQAGGLDVILPRG